MLAAVEEMDRVQFSSKPYDKWKPTGMIIYCDPPYAGNKVSNKFFSSFDHNKFWEVMRTWSETNLVFVSEKSASEDFVSIWEKQYKVSFLTGGKKNVKKIYGENLFVYESYRNG